MAVTKVLARLALGVISITTAGVAAAVECYPADRVKADLDSKGYTLHRSAKTEKMELFAYASAQEKRWLIFAQPPQESVTGAPKDEVLLCPLDADEGGVDELTQSPYYKKYFNAPSAGGEPAAEAAPNASP